MPADTDDLYVGGGSLAKNPSWHEEHSPWKARQILRMIARNNLEPGLVSQDFAARVLGGIR
jgi:hypothetical protein